MHYHNGISVHRSLDLNIIMRYSITSLIGINGNEQETSSWKIYYKSKFTFLQLKLYITVFSHRAVEKLLYLSATKKKKKKTCLMLCCFPLYLLQDALLSMAYFMNSLLFSSLLVTVQTIPRALPFFMSEFHSLLPSREERLATM